MERFVLHSNPLSCSYRKNKKNKKACHYVCSFCLSYFSVQITVDCIENIPPVDLVLGEHVFLSVGDFRTKSQ